MKRILVAIACLALAAPAWAEKTRRVPVEQSPGARRDDDLRHSPDDRHRRRHLDAGHQLQRPGTGQFYPPDCAAGQTADSGVFVSSGGVVYGPDFNNHPCGSASNSYTPWAPVSLSAVRNGHRRRSLHRRVVADAVAAQIRLTETITYVNGNPGAGISLSFAAIAPPGLPAAPTDPAFDAFLGGDLYLADSDSGFGAQVGTQYGGRGASSACAPLNYTILLGGTTAPGKWSATGFGTIWDEISAGDLNDAVDSSICQDNGAAIEWTGLATPDRS